MIRIIVELIGRDEILEMRREIKSEDVAEYLKFKILAETLALEPTIVPVADRNKA